jgi:hypothetical protein
MELAPEVCFPFASSDLSVGRGAILKTIRSSFARAEKGHSRADSQWDSYYAFLPALKRKSKALQSGVALQGWLRVAPCLRDRWAASGDDWGGFWGGSVTVSRNEGFAFVNFGF